MCAPTSTNPQLMASRSNRPQQPHILQRPHVHNSFARSKKKRSPRKYKRFESMNPQGFYQIEFNCDQHLHFRDTEKEEVHFVWLLKETVGVISDILRLGSECVVSLILRNMHSSPWWPWAEPSDHICAHNPPIYRIKGKSSVWLCSVYQLRSSCKRVEKRNKKK